MRFFKNPKLILVLLLLIVPTFIGINLYKQNKVLGAKTTVTTSPSPSTIAAFHTLSPKPTASPTPAPKLSKPTYTIALFGDSMIDTMGDMKYLSDALTKKYPETKFNLYNYGIGGQNVQKGLDRLASEFSYQDRSYLPLNKVNADVIIFGTFAYNPFENHDIARYKSTLTSLIQQTSAFNKNIYLLIEIATLGENFGKGPHGVNWPPDLAQKQSQHIEEQLLAAKIVAKSLNIPTIDVYSKTKGTTMYTNPDDGIHPSVYGHMYTASLIVQTVVLK